MAMGNELKRCKVVILAGGLGMRLHEETEFRPKPMILIGNKPILWHIMKIYSSHGFNDFIICLGYKGEMIKNYFLNYEVLNSDFTIHLGSRSITWHGSRYDEHDWSVTLVDTGLSTLTGGRIKRIEKYIDSDNFMATYGDGIASININKLLQFHLAHGKVATLSGVRPTGRFGHLSVVGNEVYQFEEKPRAAGGWINGGFFVFNRRVFDYLDDVGALEETPLRQLAQDHELAIYKHHGHWRCMDTYRDMVTLQEEWDSGNAGWKIWE